MRFVEFVASARSRPGRDAARAAAICASGRLFAINGDARRLRRIAAALGAYPAVEVSLHPSLSPWLLMACPRGRGDELLPIGVRV
jgi:hypothetical protein